MLISIPSNIYPVLELPLNMVVHFFKFFKEPPVFHKTVLSYITTNSISFPFSPYPWYNLLSLIFLVKAILTGAKCYLTLGLMCISLMVRDNEYLFIYLLTICMCLLVKGLFKFFFHFKIGLFAFFCWIVWVLYIFCTLVHYQIHGL